MSRFYINSFVMSLYGNSVLYGNPKRWIGCRSNWKKGVLMSRHSKLCPYVRTVVVVSALGLVRVVASCEGPWRGNANGEEVGSRDHISLDKGREIKTEPLSQYSYCGMSNTGTLRPKEENRATCRAYSQSTETVSDNKKVLPSKCHTFWCPQVGRKMTYCKRRQVTPRQSVARRKC